jgi:hypothetical protein
MSASTQVSSSTATRIVVTIVTSPLPLSVPGRAYRPINPLVKSLSQIWHPWDDSAIMLARLPKMETQRNHEKKGYSKEKGKA